MSQLELFKSGRSKIPPYIDPINNDLASKLNGGEDGAIRMVAALMLDDTDPEYMITFFNEERGFYENY